MGLFSRLFPPTVTTCAGCGRVAQGGLRRLEREEGWVALEPSNPFGFPEPRCPNCAPNPADRPERLWATRSLWLDDCRELVLKALAKLGLL